MARLGVRQEILRSLLTAGQLSATDLQERLPRAIGHKPHITEELRGLERVGAVDVARHPSDARIRLYAIRAGSRLAAVHSLYDVGRDALPKRAGAGRAADTDALRGVTNELVASASPTRGDMAFAPLAYFGQYDADQLEQMSLDFLLARSRLRSPTAGRGRPNAIRRRRDDYHKDGAMDIQALVVFSALGAEVVDDAKTGPMSLEHVESGLQSSDADLASMPMSTYLSGREELIANDLLPVSVGLPWTQHAVISTQASKAKVIDKVYTVGCSVLSPQTVEAFRLRDVQVEGATLESVRFEDAASRMRSTVDDRVAFLMEAHMAIPLRSSLPKDFVSLFTMVDQGVQLARGETFAPWLAGSAADFRRSLHRLFEGIPQKTFANAYAIHHFSRIAGAVVPGLPGKWSASDVSNPVLNLRMPT